MAKQAIVIANHKDQRATLNFIDEENGVTAVDYKNQPFTGISFPYSNIEEYSFLFESLGQIDEDNEKFLFKIL